MTLLDRGPPTVDLELGKAVAIQHEDQNFGRQCYVRRNYSLCCCIIPKGKYVVTGKEQFRLLTVEDMGMYEKWFIVLIVCSYHLVFRSCLKHHFNIENKVLSDSLVGPSGPAGNGTDAGVWSVRLATLQDG